MKKILVFVMMFALVLSSVLAISTETAKINKVLLNQDPDPAEQGQYVELRWKITKEGTDKIENVQFELVPEYPFSFDASDTSVKDLGNWDGFSDDDEYYTLYYKLKVADDALQGDYDLTLVTYYNKVSTTNDYTIRVGQKTSPEFVIGTMTTSPIKLLSDTVENKLIVTLENIGDENAEVVKTELKLPEGFSASYGYSNIDNLGTVKSDSSASSEYYIDIDDSLEEGNYEGKLIINYKESNDDDNLYKQIELPVIIPIKGQPELIVDKYEVINEVSSGNLVELKLTIKNKGTKEAESVSIRAFKESSQPFKFEDKSDFVGKLMPGETGEAILRFNVEKDSVAKNYLMDLELRGVYNEEVVIDEDVIKVEVVDSNSSNLIRNIIIAVVVLAALIVGFKLFKKRK